MSIDFENKESRLKYLDEKLDNLLSGINSTYGQALLDELVVRLERTIKDFNEEVEKIMGNLKDNSDRKNKIIELQHGISLEKNESFIGKTLKVLVDQAENEIGVGRTEFDSPEIDNIVRIDGKVSKGDFINVKIEKVNEFELIGQPL